MRRGCQRDRAALMNWFFFLVKDSPQGQPLGTTNRQLPTATKRQMPPTANHQPPPTTNRQPFTNHQPSKINSRQPPPTANYQLPTANCHQPPTAANRQPLFNDASVVMCLAHVLGMKQRASP